MSRTIEEQLSAFLDDALPPEEEGLLLRRLESSAGHRSTLSRYGLVGEILRGNRQASLTTVFAERVSLAVAAEDDLLPAPDEKPAGRRGFAGFGLAAAAAAAIAVVAIGFNQSANNGAEPVPVATPVAQPLRFDEFDASKMPRSRLATSRLTAYLVSHGDYSRGLSRQIMNSNVVNQRAELLQASYQQDPASD
jgi:negative regulator of sigma E activity